MIEIPERMKALPVVRNFPVPYIVQWDDRGNPLFTVNDGEKQRKCTRKKLCSICGQRLTRELWFVGGPGSAFHEHGAFFDSAMHHECLTYALQVCPHLARVIFKSNIEAKFAVLEKAVGDSTLLMDHTQDPKRPEMFVVVMSYGQSISPVPWFGRAYHIAPLRPYHGVEFWRHGKQIPMEEGIEIALAHDGVTRGDLDAALRLIRGKV